MYDFVILPVPNSGTLIVISKDYLLIEEKDSKVIKTKTKIK